MSLPNRVVVVGSGPAGVAVAEQLCRHEAAAAVLLLGDEASRPYDRVRLSSLLARELMPSELYTDRRLGALEGVTVLGGRRVVRIDREAKVVHDQHGSAFEYSTLVLATGSRPRVPPIPGIELSGVYVFRSMRDAERLLARQIGSRVTVVIGGGLLGLEAARAMLRFRTEVHVVEHESRLMFHQLDDAAASMLCEHVQRIGIEVRVAEQVREIVGTHRPEAVRLRSGAEIDCDTVIVATGISPNMELARDVGIAVGRGIRVDDRMQTSDPDIYAIGECCEHRDVVYGLVGPAIEQAAVAASNIAGVAAEYRGSTVASSLKVVGCPVFSMGEIDNSARPLRARTFSDGERYRRLNVYKGRLIGAVGIGEWDVARLRITQLEQRRVWPWQLRRFARSGRLWPDDETGAVRSWAAGATICTCRGISRATLDAAIAEGAASVAELAAQTGASTVCGSCRPLLVNLLGTEAVPEKVGVPRALLGGSLVGGALAILAYVWSLPYAATMVSAGPLWDVIWTAGLHKQISGFTLLALGLFVSLLSLRKRVRRFTWARFSTWQLAHVLIGVLAAAALLVHTGFRAGSNLNFLLMFSFTGLVLTGGVLGIATALAHSLNGIPWKSVRTTALWAHIVLLWPLPVLLGFHIFTGYYF